MENFYVVKILFLTALASLAAVLWTPLLTHFLYKYRLGKSIRNNGTTPIFTALHKEKEGTPTMGGLIIWVTVLAVALVFFYAGKFIDLDFFRQLNFLTRSQTLLPLGSLVAAAIIGLGDDILDIRGRGKGGLSIKQRLLIYTLIAAVGALWFYFKLDWDLLHVPFVGNFQIGWWYIPIFIFIIVATAFSVNFIDGLDGLAGGTLLTAFGAYGVIAFVQGKYDLAAFCGVIIGALIAFLWFNIKPARFFMGDTGAMSLGVTLGIIAMLTNQALLLPIIGVLFVVETFSSIIQFISKKLRGKKIFLSSPIHHHLEAVGWPEYKIVMRFWLISGVSAVIGLILFLLDK
ncbi:phospho-N-acetylmuramoyl-pentapeptide-transferase [Candidatus Falkowbacteria bacterium RIFCSPLOWO2_12_FULL_45_10]|uniref:Phospho-N-acetylmuramoyl-pentapeptide-transferase n=3 Tax=Candidatus Falkowiibacteriota TaxID=1752728 RepID=A0A1F5RLF5_9BACT|nr:MAG: phospho-N-acetylmuramoyl-pentapeptide-transferase [Candidatus Falkowbacteria bacterium RIFCSPHIGHO2_02_FULL_45_15]OGF18571.1 MAG: phospho-N-acetylmuramoyl-pentapeptide-transferase [Candidatus Falkowbacteria bacterium RIFCSPLOWO2_02_FULL_45_15]OGF18867.1 MAG: phospho-N-acetylmuramoyl-pentapeptide-transferase [Candidatus Falkowbacteria bacterium RIFCSPLOWO2_12_FULL_45_10]